MTDTTAPSAEPLPVLLGRVLRDTGAVGKSEKAPAQMGGYNFRGIEGIVSALKPALAEHGVFFIPKTMERVDTQRPVGGNKLMFCVDLKMRYVFMGPAGDRIKVGPIWGTGTDMGDKAVQKAYTAAEKVMLVELFAIGDSASDSERHDVPDTEQRTADPDEWFHANGWLGGKAQHDDRFRVLADTIRSLPDEQRATMKEAIAAAGEAEGIDWRGAWTASMADRVEAKIAQLASSSPAGDTATPAPEVPPQAPQAPESPVSGQSGEATNDGEERCAGCGEPIPLDRDAKKATEKLAIGELGESFHARCVPFPDPDPPATIGDLRDQMEAVKP